METIEKVMFAVLLIGALVLIPAIVITQLARLPFIL
jgi:hypothetical protein